MPIFSKTLSGFFAVLILCLAIHGHGEGQASPVLSGQMVVGSADGGRLSVAPLPGAPLASTQSVQVNFDALAHAFLSDERVEVIVTLRQPAEVAALDLAVEPLLQMAMMHNDALSAQSLSRLSAQEFELGHRYRAIAGFSGHVTLDGLCKLLEDENVESVALTRVMKPLTRQGLPLMGAMAYRSQFRGKGVSIAIMDTGIDYNHPLLGNGGFPNAKILGGYDMGENDPDPLPDGDSHGTACAGIAAGDFQETGDYIGGVAPDARLYNLKISVAPSHYSTDEIMVRAIDWCIQNKNRHPSHPLLVISISFGGDRHTSPEACDTAYPAMAAVAKAAKGAGITILAASGNEFYCDALGAPACVSDIISVGAVYDARMGDFPHCALEILWEESCIEGIESDYCAGLPIYVQDKSAPDKVIAYSNTAYFLDLLAPSEKAYTLDISGMGGYSTDGFAPDFNGTSAACPYAAGAAAVLQSAARETLGRYLTPDEVKARLLSTGRMITDTKVAITKPRVDLKRALDTVITVPPTPQPEPTPWPAYYDIRYYRNGRLDQPSLSITADGIFIRQGAGDRDRLVIRSHYRNVEGLPMIPTIHSPGGFQKIHLEGPVGTLRAEGAIRNLVAPRGHVRYLSAPQIGRVAMMNLARSGSTNRLLTTTIEAIPDGEDWAYTGAPLQVRLVGVSLASLQAPAQRASVVVASRPWRTLEGAREVSLGYLPLTSGRNVVAGDLARLVVHGGGIHATQVVSLSGPAMQVMARGGMFWVGDRDSRYQAWYPGDVIPGTLECGAGQLQVQALGGDIRASSILADNDIRQLRAATRRLPWRQQVDQEVYSNYSGGFIVCGEIVAGRGQSAASIGAIHADWGVNWIAPSAGGAPIFYRQNRIQAGDDCRGTVALVSSRPAGQRAQPFGVRQGDGPYLCGTVYAVAPPQVQGGRSEGYLLWSNTCGQ